MRLLRHYAPADVRAFILAIAFAWITAETDAHLRNFSLLVHPGGGATQAPLYDLAHAAGPDRPRCVDPEARRSRLPRGMLPEVAELAATVADVAPAVAEQLIDEEQLDAGYLRGLARSVAARAARCAAELGGISG